MKIDIILAGVGGQGILSIAASIGMAALDYGLYLKQAEVHGMSQRGGAVQSNLRISSKEIASDLIPLGNADLIISLEPMEALRYLPYLSATGWLITNMNPVENIPDYPDLDELDKTIKNLPNYIALDADQMAYDAGSKKSTNMVVLGAASSFIEIPFSLFEQGIKKIFSRKGEEVVNINLKALRKGREYSEDMRKQST